MGASAGGVEALRALVSGLPAEFPAALFVVLHLPAWGHSALPAILSHSGPLPAEYPQDGSPIQNGRIYVGPPDRHLLIEKGCIRLGTGPKENRHRPAVNTLFRSAAQAYGSRVVGVILTGALDDGTAGLWEIKRRGGVGVIQEPLDALFPGMPQSALDNVEVDYSVPLHAMAKLFTELASGSLQVKKVQAELSIETKQSHITCPECRGPITECGDEKFSEFRCRVGHSYSPQSFLAAHAETRERTLWAAVVALEEAAELARYLAPRMPPAIRAQFEREADENERAAARTRELIAMLTRANSQAADG